MFEFLSDRKVLIGIGIGIIISAGLMIGKNISSSKLTDVEIYNRAKAMGMDYPDNFKVINNGGTEKW